MLSTSHPSYPVAAVASAWHPHQMLPSTTSHRCAQIPSPVTASFPRGSAEMHLGFGGPAEGLGSRKERGTEDKTGRHECWQSLHVDCKNLEFHATQGRITDKDLWEQIKAVQEQGSNLQPCTMSWASYALHIASEVHHWGYQDNPSTTG